MRIVDMLILGVIGFLILISLLNPGGWLIVGLIVVFLVVVRGAVPWLANYYTAVNQGRAGRTMKQNQRQRRQRRGQSGGEELDGDGNGNGGGR